jgi:hypothetical protein
MPRYDVIRVRIHWTSGLSWLDSGFRRDVKRSVHSCTGHWVILNQREVLVEYHGFEPWTELTLLDGETTTGKYDSNQGGIDASKAFSPGKVQLLCLQLVWWIFCRDQPQQFVSQPTLYTVDKGYRISNLFVVAGLVLINSSGLVSLER